MFLTYIRILDGQSKLDIYACDKRSVGISERDSQFLQLVISFTGRRFSIFLFQLQANSYLAFKFLSIRYI
jgi:hypothetical protein